MDFKVENNEQIYYISFLERGMTAFDIGTNVGEISLLFSRFVGPNGQVHSFEPFEETYNKADQVFKLCQKKNIKLNNLLVLDHNRGENFYVYPETHSSWNTIAERPLELYGIPDIKPEKILKLPSTTVEKYCKDNKIKHIDLLKIDVEGAELKVLEGAKNMFLKKQITCCVFEFGQTTHDAGYKAQDLLDFFEEVDYQVHNLSEEQGLFPIDKRNGWAEFSVHVAYPK
jgi:FkbM family methyltransferase